MKTQHEHWSSRIGFIMAAAGSAIGLGSLWRFPYIAGDNGGGIFVLLYTLFTLFIGLPVFIGELIVGRASQKSAALAYSSLTPERSGWRFIGFLNILTTFIILSYYCVVSGWCLNYALMSINQFTLGKSPDEIRAIFKLVFESSDINIFWLILFILINIGVLYSGVRQGIEKWSRILTPTLLFLLLGLFVYAVSLRGFPEAFRFIFYPDFSKLSPGVILNALGMAFFTLSVGLGIIVTYGSYLKSDENMPKTALIVSGMTLAVSFMAAMMIFPIVFTFGFPPEGGPGLVFQTMPVLFSKVKASMLISTLFFILFVFTALTSSISLFEVLIANAMELLNWSRAKAVLIAAGGIFIFALPTALSGSRALFPDWVQIYGKDFFDTMNQITASWMMPIAGLLTTLYIGIVLKRDVSKMEFLRGTSWGRLYHVWFFTIRYIAPIAVGLIILQEAGLLSYFQ